MKKIYEFLKNLPTIWTAISTTLIYFSFHPPSKDCLLLSFLAEFVMIFFTPAIMNINRQRSWRYEKGPPQFKKTVLELTFGDGKFIFWCLGIAIILIYCFLKYNLSVLERIIMALEMLILGLLSAFHLFYEAHCCKVYKKRIPKKVKINKKH